MANLERVFQQLTANTGTPQRALARRPASGRSRATTWPQRRCIRLVITPSPQPTSHWRRYPAHFASFAQDATWYRNATGVSPFTPYAVPAMLTGRYPAKSLAPSHTEYPDNLFTLLADSYQVRAWETVTQLCPPRVCTASAEANGGTGWQALAGDSARVWEQIVSPRRSSDDNPAAQFTEATVRERRQAAGQPPRRRGPTFRFDQLKANQPARFADFLEQLKAATSRTSAGPPRRARSNWPSSASSCSSPTPMGWSARSSSG